ncbi:MAG: PEGA domain-containing protein, partial [bacterium]
LADKKEYIRTLEKRLVTHHIASGTKFAKSGDYKNAMNHFNMILEIDPDNQEVEDYLARLPRSVKIEKNGITKINLSKLIAIAVLLFLASVASFLYFTGKKKKSIPKVVEITSERDSNNETENIISESSSPDTDNKKLKVKIQGNQENKAIINKVPLVNSGKRNDQQVKQIVKENLNAEIPANISNNTQAQAIPSDSGYLFINSKPFWARVFIDGKYLGKTGSTYKLMAGKHEIVLKSAAGKTYKHEIEIMADKTNRHIAKLELKPSFADKIQ